MADMYSLPRTGCARASDLRDGVSPRQDHHSGCSGEDGGDRPSSSHPQADITGLQLRVIIAAAAGAAMTSVACCSITCLLAE
eukprot:3393754-Rhodomonas_salina.1